MEEQHKIDLKNITFCIPVRIESFYRIQNLKTVLKYLDKHFDTNYIVLEGDGEPHFKVDMDIRNLHYLFVKDEDVIFHRTKYINQMLNMVQTPYAAIWDTDAIAPVEQIEKAYAALQSSGNALIYPFSGAFIALNENLSRHFYDSLDMACISSPHLPKFFHYGFYSVGGAYMVNVEKYRTGGGENEYFYGWGPEDAERNVRMQILELGVLKIEGELYHLYHTRGINSRPSKENTNKKEFCKICGMTTPELVDYIKTWSWNNI